MLDIKLVRDNPQIVKESLKKRNDPEKLAWLDDLIKVDTDWRKIRGEIDELRAKRNKITEEVKIMKSQNQPTEKLIDEAKSIPDQIKLKESKLKELEEKTNFYLYRLPNILDKTVPQGKDDTENVVVKTHGKVSKPNFDMKPHGDFLQEYNLADFKRGAKTAGAGFYYLYDKLALLEFALIKFAIDELTKKGYNFIEVPLMLNKEAYKGAVDLADFENVMYKIENEDYYLIATAEHAICALYKDEILNDSQLPIKFVSYSPCFRREIGKHGIDTRGLFRVHQFNKVEQFIFCRPNESAALHEELLANSEYLFQSLEIPYRVVNVCTGDMGSIAAKKYDIEAWMPRENSYKEVVSCSNCTSYQAARSNIKFRKGENKEYVHTLNSTAIATSRALRSIVENYQQKDGSILIPKVLIPYMGGTDKINISAKK